MILTTRWNSTTSYEDQPHITTAQYTKILPITLVISESQFTFLMEVCFDLIFLNDLCHYMLFSISEFSANNYTFISHELALAPNICRPSSYMASSPRFYFFNLVPIICALIISISKPYFSHIWY